MKSSEFITEVSRRGVLGSLLGGAALGTIGSEDVRKWIAPANRRPDNKPDAQPKPTTPSAPQSTTKIDTLPPPKPQTQLEPEPVKKPRPKTTPEQRQYGLMIAAEANGIHGLELAQFMAQCAVESHDFRALETYSTEDKLKSYATLKNVGNITRDDNWLYRARGYIHLFGRENYRTIGQKLGIDLESKPDLAAVESWAEKIAVEFWKLRVRPYMQRHATINIDRTTGKPASKQSRPENIVRMIDWTDTRSVTYPINKNLELLDRRVAAFKYWREKVANYERGYRTLEEAPKRKSKKSKSKRSSRSRSNRVSGVFFPGYWGWGGEWSAGDGGADGGGE